MMGNRKTAGKANCFAALLAGRMFIGPPHSADKRGGGLSARTEWKMHARSAITKQSPRRFSSKHISPSIELQVVPHSRSADREQPYPNVEPELT